MESIATWVAPVATTIAALMTASNLGSRVTGWGFAVFLIGSIAWAMLGYATGQSNLVWQNAILSVLNLFGIWRWLGRQTRIEEGGQAAAEASEAMPGENLFPVSLLGKAKLAGAGGTELGSCIDAMAGCGSGRIHYLVVSQGGVAGVGETLHRLPWAAVRVDGEQVSSALDAAAFAGLERLEADQWPGR